MTAQQEMHLVKSVFSEDLKYQCGAVVSRQVKEALEGLPDLPQYLYVDSTSSEYFCRSLEDWRLVIIVFDRTKHRLVQIVTEFATNDGTFTPLEEPQVLGTDVLPDDSWMDYVDQLTQMVVETKLKVRFGERVESPEHTITGHTLVPCTISYD